MEQVGLLVSVVSTGAGFISSYFSKHKLNHLEKCQKVTSKDFTGFGYLEGKLTSPNPFKFEFGNTPYSLLVKQMVYDQPKTRYIKDENGSIHPVVHSNIIYGSTEYANPIFIGDMKICQKFVKSYFPMFHLNKTYSFNPSIDVNFITGDVSFDGSTWTNLHGLPNNIEMTVIGDFDNGEVVESDKINYVGKESFRTIKKNNRDTYNISMFFTGIGTLGIVGFSIMLGLNK